MHHECGVGDPPGGYLDIVRLAYRVFASAAHGQSRRDHGRCRASGATGPRDPSVGWVESRFIEARPTEQVEALGGPHDPGDRSTHPTKDCGDAEPRPGTFHVQPVVTPCRCAVGLALGAGIRSTEPGCESDGRRMENGGVLSDRVRGRSIYCVGWMRRIVEHDVRPQRPPLIGPIVYERGCRNRQGDSFRTAHARTRHARAGDRPVTGRLRRAVFRDGRHSDHDQLVETIKAGNQSGWRADAMAAARLGGGRRTEAVKHQDHEGPGSQPHQPRKPT
jgi:hypothetical protein